MSDLIRAGCVALVLLLSVAAPVTAGPFEDAAGRGYHIRGEATYGRLLAGVVSVVPPG